MNKTLLIVLLITVLDVVLTTEDENCALFGANHSNHSIAVSTQDKTGKKCRGKIHIAVCGGLCKTSEKGSHIFPNKENENSACIPTSVVPSQQELTDCDDGILPEARIIKYSEPNACGCKELPSVSH
uniref:Uncharacterized protein n=1 Tax=Panagrolaimus sp. JU765 TaxID=591449 RepID=A0AC34RAI3_9BILA